MWADEFCICLNVISSDFLPQIRGRPDVEIDSEDTSMSNWVRYVNCARNYIEENLTAMQIQNEIFCVTNTEIERFVCSPVTSYLYSYFGL